jgi:hypothetical protein
VGGGSSADLGRGQSANSAGSRGLISAGGSDMGEVDTQEEEDKESHVINAKGGAGGATNSKQDNINIMKKFNIKNA